MKNRVITFIQNLRSQIFSERGEIGDSFMIVIVIFVSVGIMFIFPIMTIADRTDDMAQQTIQVALEKAADTAAMTGKITPELYSETEATIASTGILGDLEVIIQVKDDNPEKKGVQVERDKVDGTWYYTIYGSQVYGYMFEGEEVKPFKLSPGYRTIWRFKNASLSFGQQVGSFFYTILGKNVSNITAEASAMCMTESTGN